MPKEILLRDAGKALTDLMGKLTTEAVVRALNEESGDLADEIMLALRGTTLAKALAGQNVFSPGKRGNRVKKRKPIKNIFTTVYSKGEFAGRPTLVVKAFGIAAMIEAGGHTQAHDIFPSGRFAKQLKGKARQKFGEGAQALFFGGRFSGGHRHPGSSIKPHGVIRQAMEAARARVAARLEQAMQAEIDRSPLG